MTRKIRLDTETAAYMAKVAEAIRQVGDGHFMETMTLAVSRVEFVLDGDSYEFYLEPDGDFPDRLVIEKRATEETR